MARLSIIIPVYQVETTLDRCIESILRQSFTDYEIILVDDGSTDGSGKICDEWKEREPRISVIHQSNRGLSAARNTGLELARGEYIAFVDSDDTLADNTLAEIMQGIERYADCRIIEFPVFVRYGSRLEYVLTFKERLYNNVKDYWLNQQGYLHAYTCNKVYRRDLFKTIRFPDGKVFEDVITTARLLQEAGSIATIDKGLYYYMSNPKGITCTAGRDDLRQLLQWHCDIIHRFFPLNTKASVADSLYYMHLVNIQLDVYHGNHADLILPEYDIKPTFFLHGKPGITTKLKAAALMILGLKRLCTIHNILRH